MSREREQKPFQDEARGGRDAGRWTAGERDSGRAGVTAEMSDPAVALWIANAWGPYRHDRAVMDRAMADIRGMGFNAVMLDSKSCEDFFQYAEDGAVSDYIDMQLYMMESAKANGMSYLFMGLWAGGDNWGSYGQGIRSSDPRMPAESMRTDPEGRRNRWYDYGSAATLDITSEHLVHLLTKLRRDNYARWGSRLPIVSHWDPSIYDFENRCMGSHDEATVQQYRNWLKIKYNHIGALRDGHGLPWAEFDDVRPPSALLLRHGDLPAEQLGGWQDWLRFLSEQLVRYLASLRERVRAHVPNALLAPCLQQWGLLFQLEDCHQLSWRGINPFEAASAVDAVFAIPLPLDPEGRPEARAISCEAALLRSAARFRGRLWFGGMFGGVALSGRRMHETVSPGQYVGMLAGHGAASIIVYGYNGEDDGGNMMDLSPAEKETMRLALDWYRRVYPLLQEREPSPSVVIAFPFEALLGEPGMEPDRALRRELLDWHLFFSRRHMEVEFADVRLAEGRLPDECRLLVFPAVPPEPSRVRPAPGPFHPDTVRRLHEFAARGNGIVISDADARAYGLAKSDGLTKRAEGAGAGADAPDRPAAPLPPSFRTGAGSEWRARAGEWLSAAGPSPVLELEDGDEVEAFAFRRGWVLVNHGDREWRGTLPGDVRIRAVHALHATETLPEPQAQTRRAIAVPPRQCAFAERWLS